MDARSQRWLRKPQIVLQIVRCALPPLVLGLWLSPWSLSIGAAYGQQVDTTLDLRGTDISQMVAHRDHTRVTGLVLDSSGRPLEDVDLWVMNDIAPAERYRARGRKSGSYLLRNLGKLFSRDDIEDIVFRVLFQKKGYRPVRGRVYVVKNNLGRMHAVLYREDEEPEMEGICTVLEGRVTDERGNSVKGAKVVVTTPAGDRLAAGETERAGEYRLVVWNAPEEVQVAIEKSGLSHEARVELEAPEFVDVIYPEIHDAVLE